MATTLQDLIDLSQQEPISPQISQPNTFGGAIEAGSTPEGTKTTSITNESERKKEGTVNTVNNSTVSQTRRLTGEAPSMEEYRSTVWRGRNPQDEIKALNSSDPRFLSNVLGVIEPGYIDPKEKQRQAKLQGLSDAGRLLSQAFFGTRGADVIPIGEKTEKLLQEAETIERANLASNQKYRQNLRDSALKRREYLEGLDAKQSEGYQKYIQDFNKYNNETIKNSESRTEREYSEMTEDEKKNWRFDEATGRYVRRSGSGNGSSSEGNTFAGYKLQGKGYYNIPNKDYPQASYLATLIERDDEFKKFVKEIAENIQTNAGRIEMNTDNKYRISKMFDIAHQINPEKFYQYVLQSELPVSVDIGASASVSNPVVNATAPSSSNNVNNSMGGDFDSDF